MRKLIFTLFLVLACMSSAWAQQNTIKVSTAKELSDALENNADNSNAVIQLVADIDMAQYEKFSSIDHYNGSLTGYYEDTEEGETITTYRVIKNLKTNLVDDMTGAKVSGIMFRDGERGDKFIGGLNACFLCEDAKDCDFTDIILVNCHYKESSFGGDLWADRTGLLTNKMNHCNVTNVAIMACSLCSDGAEIGGIVGVATNGCKFKDCIVDSYTSLYTSWDPNAYIGGIVGTTEDCSFEKCANMGTVSASHLSDNLGGIAGRSTKCHFTDCLNQGTVTQFSTESFSAVTNRSMELFLTHFTAFSARTFTWLNLRVRDVLWVHPKSFPIRWYRNHHYPKPEEYSAFQAERTIYGYYGMVMAVVAAAAVAYEIAMRIYNAQNPDEVGGISSLSYGCTFDRCSNEGLVACRDAYCGGIVGYADTKDGQITKINECINIGYVQGGEQTGGIVGYLKDSHATNCFNAGSVDCLKDTKGPIYGDTNAKGATITTCFALEHDAKYEGNATGGEGVIVKFGETDVVGGRATYEMNRIIGKEVFRQTVGEDYYPNFIGNEVKVSDINPDIDLTYHVSDVGSFCTALMNQYATIELQNDIDFGQKYISLYRSSYKFRGTIDGKGHTIKNIKIDATEQDEKFDQKNERQAIIQFAEGATFKNLTLDSLTVKRNVLVAGLVGNSTKCTYEDINIKNSTIYAENSFIGGLVYESNQDTITHCTTDGKTYISTHGLPAGKLYAYAGGLVSQAKGSTFTDCINGADVSGKCDCVGGIVALDEGSTFTRCINKGYIHHESWAIHDDDELGGIVGEAEFSKFYECTNAGKLKCEDENGGGIVGLGTYVTITNCLNTSKELDFGSSTCGGIIGNAKNSTVANCLSLAERPGIGVFSDMGLASGNNYSLNAGSSSWDESVTEELLKSGIVAIWLNNGVDNREKGKMPWRQNLGQNGGKYPDLDPSLPEVKIDNLNLEPLEPVEIDSPEMLFNFATRVNIGGKFSVGILTADIDMTDQFMLPIGIGENLSFRGIFDGQGHTISGLDCSTDADMGAGLFGVVHTGAVIRNVTVKDSKFSHANDYGAAGIVGRISFSWWGNVMIENCASYADVHAKKHAGGILGHITSEKASNFYVYINNCYNGGTITAEEGNSGLLCGYISNLGHVSNSWSHGQLRNGTKKDIWPYSIENDKNNPVAECLVGYGTTLDIKNCYIVNPKDNVDQYDKFKDQYPLQAGVTIIDEAELATGEFTYKLNGNTNDVTKGLTWQQNLATDKSPVLGDLGLYYTRDINKDRYGTICLPYELEADNTVEYYTFVSEEMEGDELKLRFKSATSIAAGNPALFLAKTTRQYNFQDVGEGIAKKAKTNISYVSGAQWKFIGTYVKQVFEGDEAKEIYYISNNELRHAKKVTMDPYRAFFHGPNSASLFVAGAKSVSFEVENEFGQTTKLKYVDNELVPVQDEKSYSPMGVQVGDNYKGVVIKSGKKMILK